MSDFVLILSLLLCWLFGGSALVLGNASEEKLNLYKKLIFHHFYESHWYLKNGIHHLDLVKIWE